MNEVGQALIRLARQQAITLLETLDAIGLVREADGEQCPHPEDKVVSVGTMGRTSRMCRQCGNDITTQDKEAAS